MDPALSFWPSFRSILRGYLAVALFATPLAAAYSFFVVRHGDTRLGFVATLAAGLGAAALAWRRFGPQDGAGKPSDTAEIAEPEVRELTTSVHEPSEVPATSEASELLSTRVLLAPQVWMEEVAVWMGGTTGEPDVQVGTVEFEFGVHFRSSLRLPEVPVVVSVFQVKAGDSIFDLAKRIYPGSGMTSFQESFSDEPYGLETTWGIDRAQASAISKVELMH